MTEYITNFDDRFPLAELEDFEIGDHVQYRKNVFGWRDRPPLYLEDCYLIVVRKTKEKVVCTCKEYPDETWHFVPCHLTLIGRSGATEK